MNPFLGKDVLAKIHMVVRNIHSTISTMHCIPYDILISNYNMTYDSSYDIINIYIYVRIHELCLLICCQLGVYFLS